MKFDYQRIRGTKSMANFPDYERQTAISKAQT